MNESVRILNQGHQVFKKLTTASIFAINYTILAGIRTQVYGVKTRRPDH